MRHCQKYLSDLCNSIEKKSTFDKWFNEGIPSIEDINVMVELSNSIPDKVRDKYWMDFIKQNKQTAKGFLTGLKTTLDKLKKPTEGEK